MIFFHESERRKAEEAKYNLINRPVHEQTTFLPSCKLYMLFFSKAFNGMIFCQGFVVMIQRYSSAEAVFKTAVWRL